MLYTKVTIMLDYEEVKNYLPVMTILSDPMFPEELNYNSNLKNIRLKNLSYN